MGKLLRILYLCDYFGNPVFRIEILDLLNQGEAVHSLQRAVYNGVITAKHGRTIEELGAISGALSLLANIVMAWNTHRLQVAIDQAPGEYPDEVLKGIAPIGFKHINLAQPDLHLSQLGPSLLDRPAAAKNTPQVEKAGFPLFSNSYVKGRTYNALKSLPFLSVTFGTAVTARSGS